MYSMETYSSGTQCLHYRMIDKGQYQNQTLEGRLKP